MSKLLMDLEKNEIINYFVFVLQETVKDEHERMILHNRFGINLDLEDTFTSMEKTRKEIEQFLKERA